MKALHCLAATLLVAIIAAGAHSSERLPAPGSRFAHASPLAPAQITGTHARAIARVHDMPAEPNPIPTRWAGPRAIWTSRRHVVPDRPLRRRTPSDARGRITLARPAIIPDRSMNSRGTPIAKTVRQPGEGPRRDRHRLKAKEAS
jgi:hypothetical protein